MAGRVAGKVAFITGAARGQGRSHAIRLAQEGADIIAVDIAGTIASVGYPGDRGRSGRDGQGRSRRSTGGSSPARPTCATRGRSRPPSTTASRSSASWTSCRANAGIFQTHPSLELADPDWQETIDINLTGVWNTVKAALPHLIANNGGSIVLTSSVAGLKAIPNAIHYGAAKHGVIGIMRTVAVEFAQHGIRANSVHPTAVDTIMVQNESVWGLFDPANPHPSRESAEAVFVTTNTLPVPWVEPVDISNAVLFLASDEARYITGVTLPVDAGSMIK